MALNVILGVNSRVKGGGMADCRKLSRLSMAQIEIESCSMSELAPFSGQRMLAPAGTEDEDVHGRVRQPLGDRRLWCSMGVHPRKRFDPYGRSRAE